MFSKEIRKRLRERYTLPVVCPKCQTSTRDVEVRRSAWVAGDSLSSLDEQFVYVWSVGWGVVPALGVNFTNSIANVEVNTDLSDQIDMLPRNMPFGEKVPSSHIIHRLADGEVCHMWREEESLVIPPFLQFEKNVVDELERAGIADPFPYLAFESVFADIKNAFTINPDPNREVRGLVIDLISKMIDRNQEKCAVDRSLSDVFDTLSGGG